MFVPEFNKEKDVKILHSLLKSKPFGSWSSIADGDIVVNHIPFILKENESEFGILEGHVARSNNIWQKFSTELNSVVVFQGDQAYISPSW
ncbi:MAG: FMN-binding negative transcriptional regulator [Pseudomonadales bacterium]|nr:FMN-binding negative transcriptional regulator [Pseudomonadales bacterium]